MQIDFSITNSKYIIDHLIDLKQVKDRLIETVKLLQELDNLSNDSRVLNLAVKITKLTGS